MNEETNVLSGVCRMILDVSPDFFCFYTVICKVRQWTDFRIVNLACHLLLFKSTGFLSRIPFGLTCQMSEIGCQLCVQISRAAGSQALSRPVRGQCGVAFQRHSPDSCSAFSGGDLRPSGVCLSWIGLAWISSSPLARIVLRLKRNNGCKM